MNILQLISSGGFFGAENLLLQLCSELKRINAYKLIVGVFENLKNPHLEIIDEAHRIGIHTSVFPCAGRFDVKAIMKLREFIRRYRIDIIHSHGYKSDIFSLLSSFKLPISRIATCHNWLGESFNIKAYAGLDRFCLRYFDAIIPVSDDIRKKIVNAGSSPRKVHIIQNGVSVNRFNSNSSESKVRNELAIEKDAIVIGTVGRLSEEKGHRHLLEVGKEMIKGQKNLVFLIVGDGPLREDLQKEFESPHIVFTGFRSDLPELYNAMDIFVLPSLTEGLPMALLEAMASKLPTVASRVGDVSTVIVEEKTGRLVSPGNEKELKDSLEYMIENEKIAAEMGESAYERVKDHFSSERMAADYLNIYESLRQRTGGR